MSDRWWFTSATFPLSDYQASVMTIIIKKQYASLSKIQSILTVNYNNIHSVSFLYISSHLIITSKSRNQIFICFFSCFFLSHNLLTTEQQQQQHRQQNRGRETSLSWRMRSQQSQSKATAISCCQQLKEKNSLLFPEGW